MPKSNSILNTYIDDHFAAGLVSLAVISSLLLLLMDLLMCLLMLPRVSRTLRMWSDADGMLHGRFALPTAIGAQVKANIDREVQRIFRARRSGTDHEPHDRYAADALCAFVMNGATLHETQNPADTNENEACTPDTAATQGQRARSPHNTESVRTNATVPRSAA